MRRSRIAIDGFLLSVPRGIGNFLAAYLRELANLAHIYDVIVYVRAGSAVRPTSPSDAIVYRTLPAAPYPIWENVLLPAACIRDRITLLHSPGNTGPFVVPLGTSRITTVHDLISFESTDNVGTPGNVSQWLQRLYYRTLTPRAARLSKRVLTDSSYARTDIVDKLKIDPSLIDVIPLATDRALVADAECDAAILRELDIVPPYVFALGAADPRKNTAFLIRAFRRAKSRDARVGSLVVAGLTDRYRADLQDSMSEISTASRDVRLLGFVDAAALASIYRSADVFVYPSLAEGFGLPVLEAMAHGTAVIASTATSIPEVAGDAALLIDPRDESALCEALLRFATDAPLRSAYRVRGRERVRAFSWQRTAEMTLEAYRRAIG